MPKNKKKILDKFSMKAVYIKKIKVQSNHLKKMKMHLLFTYQVKVYQ